MTITPTTTPTNTPAPNGAACDDGIDCVSGNCIDDVCCEDESCPGGESCNNPGSAGVRSPDQSAPAPALSRGGVLAAVILLFGLGGLALRRRLREA